MSDKYIPLIMGDKIIGRAKFDEETGHVEGTIENLEILSFIRDGFVDGVSQISFTGNAGMQTDVVRERIAKFFDDDH